MAYLDSARWWAPWRRRTSAWGAALLDEQDIVLAALTLQSSGCVRVAVLERPPVLSGAPPSQPMAQRLAEQLRAANAHWPRRVRRLALALHEGRCRQGVLEDVAGLGPRQLAAEVQLEAASALGLAHEQVGFDYELADPGTATARVHWAACSREELQQWAQQVRRAGWRLRGVEPAAQAAQRAASCLTGEAMALSAQSPQDWQFERTPVRELNEAQWHSLCERLHASPQWGPLVACGVALGQMA